MKREKSAALRVLSRVSRLIYHIIAVSFIGKLFTSYATWNGAVTGPHRSFFKKKERVRTVRRYTVRRALACAMEQNILSRAIRKLLTVLVLCSLRSFGAFFTVAGGTWLALYGISLFVSLGGIATWAHLIAGAIALAVGILLLFSDRSVGAALYGGSIVGFLLFTVLGVPDDLVKEAEEKGAPHYLIASAIGLLVAAIGLLITPLSILQIVASLLVVLMVLSVPEAGFLLALFFLPFSKLIVGSDLLTLAFLTLMIIGYIGKLLRGNRSFRVELQDIPVILFVLLFFLSGYSVSTGNVWGDVAIEIILALSYLVAVNILSTPNWLVVSRISLAVSAVLASFLGVGQLVLAMFTASDFTISHIPNFGQTVTAGFADHVTFAYYLVIAFAVLLPIIPYTKKRYRALPLIAALVVAGAAVLTFTSAAWFSLALILIVFLLVFECRSFPFVFLSSGALTGALFLLPGAVRSYVFGVFRDITDPVYLGLRANGKATVSHIFFGSGEGFFSSTNGLLRFLFGAGHEGLVTLHPYFSDVATAFAYSAYNHWQLLLVDFGIGGLIVMVCFLFILLQNCFSVLAMSGEQNRPLFAFIGIVLVAAMALFGSFHYVWYDRGALAMFFVVTAIVAAAMRYGRQRRETVAEPDESGVLSADVDYTTRSPRTKIS